MTGIDTEMKFEEVRDSIITLLETYATGRYRVIKGQLQNIAAEQVKGTQRAIQVFYSDGDYPENQSTGSGIEHKCTFRLNYYVAAPARGDKATLESDDSTPAEKAAALLNIAGSWSNADEEMDEFRRMITQIILDPVNDQLGMPLLDRDGDPITDNSRGRKQVSSRWLSNFQKSQPLDRGNLVTITAFESLTLTLDETTPGATPVTPASNTYDIEHDFNTSTDDEDAEPAVAGVEVDAS